MRVIPWALTVSGAVWTTGNAVVAAAAIAAFQWQRSNPGAISREGLGGAVGAGFGLWSSLVTVPLFVAMVSLGWLAGTAWRTGKRVRAAWIIAAMAILWGVHSVNHQTVVEANQLAAGIRELRAAAVVATSTTESSAGGATPVGAATPLANLEQRFAVQHQASERWHGIETLLSLALLVGGSIVLLRRTASSSAVTTSA